MPVPIPSGKIDTVGDIGALVRRRRKKAGITQAETAGLCGVGNRFMSELERGKETLEVGRVLQVLHRVGMQVWLLPRGEHPSGDEQ